MALYQLKPVLLPRCPHPVASVVESARGRDSLSHHEPPSPSRPSDEWISDVWVVDESQESPQDVLQVECNLSFIQRQLGASSAETVKEVRRLTLAAFGLIGATAVHRLLKDRSLQILGYRPEWPWEAIIRRRRVQEAAVHNVLLSEGPDNPSAAFRYLLVLVVVVGMVAGIAFRQVTLGAAADSMQ